MRFWTAYAFLALGVAKAYAAGGHGHGSVSDLVAPAINVGILLGVLIWKTKGPLKAHFLNKSQEVENTLERANIKSQEAQMLLETEERKAANLDNEVKAIFEQSNKDLVVFEKNLSNETENKTHKLKADANMKIQADKKSQLDELNAELLNQVIAKTKTTIKSNKDYQNKVSSKLLREL